MKGSKFSTPDEYLPALDGWRHECVRGLRKAVHATRGLEEVIKWGHLVYMCNGPVLLIRAEEERVLFGFWRGRRLLETEPRLVPSGKYEMATITLVEGDIVKPTIARRLAKEARVLNEQLGDPRDAAKPAPRRQTRAGRGRSRPTP
jgi:hypothetical protein